MKTLADFKRLAKVGTRWTIEFNGFPPKTRTIVGRGHNSIFFSKRETPEHIKEGKLNPVGCGYYFDIPYARDINILRDGTIEVYRPKHLQSEYEGHHFTIKKED